jgi:hypothetical protein
MITTQITVGPLDLLMAQGGTVVAAQRITQRVLQRIIDAGGHTGGFQPRAAWVAILVAPGRHADAAPDALDIVDWDPTTPIPEHTYLLRCTGYTVSTVSEVKR